MRVQNIFTTVHKSTVQLNTNWHQPGLIYINENEKCPPHPTWTTVARTLTLKKGPCAVGTKHKFIRTGFHMSASNSLHFKYLVNQSGSGRGVTFLTSQEIEFLFICAI